MRISYALKELVQRPIAEIAARYLSRLGNGNTTRLALNLASDITSGFTLQDTIGGQTNLAKAGNNLGISLILLSLEQEQSLDRIERFAQAANVARESLRQGAFFGHEVFALSLSQFLTNYCLLAVYCKAYDEEEQTTESLGLATDMLAILATSILNSSRSCQHLAEILRRTNKNREALLDFVLGIDASSEKTLERDLSVLIADGILDSERLGSFYEVEKSIWAANFWEIFLFHQEAVKALKHAATKKIDLTCDSSNPRPKILRPLAVRRDVRAAIVNLQDFFCPEPGSYT